MLSAGDERRHEAGTERDWRESWQVDWWTDGGDLGGYVHLELLPHAGLAWYWACLAGDQRRLVAVIDNEVPLPRAPSVVLRTEGLWADYTVEVPFDHVTLGCEAFGLRFDDPADVFGRMLGERVPFGLDLDVDTTGVVVARGSVPGDDTQSDDTQSDDTQSDDTQRAATPKSGGYEIACRVHGDVLVGSERIDLDGMGHRSHSWGPAGSVPRSNVMRVTGAMSDGTRVVGTVAPVRTGGRGSNLAAAIRTPDEVGTTVTLTVGHRVVEVSRTALAPVPVPEPGGRARRLVRTLCRLRDPSTGATGAGWAEWSEPVS